MRTSALAAGTLAAVGLMAVTGTAFADSGQPVESTGDVQTTSSSTAVQDQGKGEGGASEDVHTLPAPVETTGDSDTKAGADASRSVVGLSVPVAADLHEGVANDLNVSDLVHLGETNVPATVGNVVKLPVNAPVDTGDANVNATTQAANGGDASAQATVVDGVGNTVGNVVASATATVGNVVGLNGLASGGVHLGN